MLAGSAVLVTAPFKPDCKPARTLQIGTKGHICEVVDGYVLVDFEGAKRLLWVDPAHGSCCLRDKGLELTVERCLFELRHVELASEVPELFATWPGALRVNAQLFQRATQLARGHILLLIKLLPEDAFTDRHLAATLAQMLGRVALPFLPGFFLKLCPELKGDPMFIITLFGEIDPVSQLTTQGRLARSRIISLIGEHLKADSAFVLQLAKVCPGVMACFCNLMKDPEFAWTLYKTIPQALEAAPRAGILHLVKRDKHALYWASSALKADRELVLEAAFHDTYCLRFASQCVMRDERISNLYNACKVLTLQARSDDLPGMCEVSGVAMSGSVIARTRCPTTEGIEWLRERFARELSCEPRQLRFVATGDSRLVNDEELIEALLT